MAESMPCMTWESQEAFIDYPRVEEQYLVWDRYHCHAPGVLCPQCHGYGGHNLRLLAYPLPYGMQDTPAVRHTYRHLRASCQQCNGWGFVDAEGPDTVCIHDYDAGTAAGPSRRTYTCRTCHRALTVECSDIAHSITAPLPPIPTLPFDVAVASTAELQAVLQYLVDYTAYHARQTRAFARQRVVLAREIRRRQALERGEWDD